MDIINSITYRAMLLYFARQYGSALNYSHNPKVMSTLDTLKEIKDKHLSLCRFGDGEFHLMFGQDLPFQKYNFELCEKMKKVFRNEDKDILIGIPDTIDGVEAYEKKSATFWKGFWGRYHRGVVSLLPKKYTEIQYANTNCTRFHSDYNDKDLCKTIIKLFKQIWDNRSVICIEGEKTRMGVGNDLFNNVKNFRRILMPAKNAFDKSNALLEYISKNKNNIDKDTLFILALGPTATVLAYDIALMGYQALDLGHLDIQYEYYLRSAHGKIAIPGKYVNEVRKGRIVTDENVDDVYLKSIIFRLL